MFALFPKFGARTRTQDLWPFLISETGLKFLIWTQSKIHPGNRVSPVNRAHMKRPLLGHGTFLYLHCTIRSWNFLLQDVLGDVNTGRQIFLSLSKLRCGPQEFNSGVTWLPSFDILIEFTVVAVVDAKSPKFQYFDHRHVSFIPPLPPPPAPHPPMLRVFLRNKNCLLNILMVFFQCYFSLCFYIRNSSSRVEKICYCAHSWNIFQQSKRDFVSPGGHVIAPAGISPRRRNPKEAL